MLPTAVTLPCFLAQASPPSAPSKSYEWCFETGKTSPLCKETEAAVRNIDR
jgi:hypothetical protein